MKYIIYYFTHERNGYAHTEYLCFPCATREAIRLKKGETIHPVVTPENKGYRSTCTKCGVDLNWINA